MDHSAVGNGEGAGEALCGKIGHGPGKDRRNILPGRALTAHGDTAERSEAEADRHVLGIDSPRLDQSGDQAGGIFRLNAEIEIDGDARIEMDVIQRLADRGSSGRKGRAVIADGALEHEHEAARAIVKIVEELCVGSFRIGKIDPLHDGPRRARDASLDAACLLRARIKRLDGNAVISLRPEGGKGHPLQRLCNERLPRLLVGGREVTGQGAFHHCRQALSGAEPLLA